MALPTRFGGGEESAADDKSTPSREERIEEALSADPAAEDAEGSEAAEAAEAAGKDGSESDADAGDTAGLFGDDPEAEEEVDEEADSESLFDGADSSDSEAGEPKPVSQKAFKARLNKLIGQRNEAREGLAAAEARASELEARVADFNAILQGAQEVYADRDSPLEQMKLDVAVLEKFEELAATDPDVAATGDKILAALKADPDAAKPSRRDQVSEEHDEAPQADPAVAALVADRRESMVADALPGTHASFQKIVSDALEDEGLDLSAQDIREAAKVVIQEYGFTEGQVYVPKQGESKAAAKPNTAGSQGRAGVRTPTKKEAEAADKKQAKEFKNIHEFREARQARIAEFLGATE